MGSSRRIGDLPAEKRPLRIAAALRRQMSIGHFAPGEVLVRQGEPVRTLYVVTSGTVRVTLGAGDHARVVATLGRGAWIGEMALLTRSSSSTTVEAATDVQALTIGHRDFIEAAEADPSIYREIARELAERLHSADDLIANAPACRVVGLEFAPRHAGHAHSVIAALGEWAPMPHVVVMMDGAGAVSSMREYLATDGAARLRSRLAVEASVVVAAIGTSASDIQAFLRVAREVTQLVVLAGEQVKSIEDGVVATRVVLGPLADLERSAPVHAYAVAAGFDAHRVARRICGRRIGLALGGGGARGFAHIGVLRALAAAGVPVDVVTGTSVGAAVAAGVADGQAPEEQGDAMERAGRWATVPNPLPLHGMFTAAFVERELRSQYGARRFEDLALPLAVIAVDLHSGEEIVLTSGELVPALLASMAVPGIFPPIRHEGRVLVDGAVRSPLPIRTCRDLGADIVIASRMRVTADARQASSRQSMPWLPETMAWSLELMQDQVSAESIGDADVAIDTLISRDRAGLFDFGHRREIEAAGESAAQSALPALAARIPGLRRAA